MDYQSLHMKTVADLKQIAKTVGARIPAGTKKAQMVELILEAEAKAPASAAPAQSAPASAAPEQKAAPTPAPVAAPKQKATPEAVPTKAATLTAEAAPAPEAAPAAKGPAETSRKTAEAAPAAGSLEVSGARRLGRTSANREAKKPEPEKAAAKKPSPRVAKAADEAPRARGRSVKKPAESDAPAPVAEAPQTSARKAAEGDLKPTEAAAQENANRHPNGQNRYAVARPMAEAAQRTRVGNGSVRQNGVGYGLRRNAAPAPGPQRGQAEGVVRAPARPPVAKTAMRSAEHAAPPRPRNAEPTQDTPESGSVRGRREGYYNAEYKTSNPAVPEMLSAGECQDGAGVLEIQQDGYGFLRAENCLPGPNDVYISIAQIRRFNLRMGDYVEGKTRAQREGDRYSAMLFITSVNGQPPEEAASRPRFEDLVPIYPDERLRLEQVQADSREDLSLRLIDMLAPIGKGQRGMIVSQPKAGKTTLLKKVANAITARYPGIKLIVLLIDERPEEVTDMKRSIDGEVIYSTFDEAPENHVRVSEMVLERAQRMVEMGQDVVVLMDSITRLARAYNLVITPTGRSLSGGLDPGALFKPKRFFGAARNIENGGSLTVIATALVDTGSRMDDIIFEEFKGTGNMELHLDRKLSDRRVFPAIDMTRSGTRREELLLTDAELEGEMLVRRVLAAGKGQEMFEQIISLMSKTGTNAEFFEKMKQWVAVYEKDGYTLGARQ